MQWGNVSVPWEQGMSRMCDAGEQKQSCRDKESVVQHGWKPCFEFGVQYRARTFFHKDLWLR